MRVIGGRDIEIVTYGVPWILDNVTGFWLPKSTIFRVLLSGGIRSPTKPYR